MALLFSSLEMVVAVLATVLVLSSILLVGDSIDLDGGTRRGVVVVVVLLVVVEQRPLDVLIVIPSPPCGL